MSAWNNAVLCGIYTISPMHVGTGQAEGAIDLPVAKEPHTGFPVIPASTLKGVARAAVAAIESLEKVTRWFGPKDDQEDLRAGEFVFTEARLVAYPARALNRPYLYVTCRLVLERLSRDLRAAGVTDVVLPALPSGAAEVLVADKALAKGLALEDLVYSENVAQSAAVADIGATLARLLPLDEQDTRDRLAKSLVVIPDEHFSALVNRLPVRARIRLNEVTKTTTGEGGNLWYEEQVPSDCLFVSFVASRKKEVSFHVALRQGAEVSPPVLAICQIGGNETVGQGLCWWTSPAVGRQAAS